MTLLKGVLSDRSRRVFGILYERVMKGSQTEEAGIFLSSQLQWDWNIYLPFGLYVYIFEKPGVWVNETFDPVSICQTNSKYCQGTVQTPSFSVGAPKGRRGGVP